MERQGLFVDVNCALRRIDVSADLGIGDLDWRVKYFFEKGRDHFSHSVMVAKMSGSIPVHATLLRKFEFVLKNFDSLIEGDYFVDHESLLLVLQALEKYRPASGPPDGQSTPPFQVLH
jgi:hypothetical protein